MNYKILIVSGVIICAGIAIAFSQLRNTDVSEIGQPVEKQLIEAAAYNNASGDNTESDFKWMSMPEALELNKTVNKKIFIDVYTNWCGPCKMLDKNTFGNEVIREKLSKYFIPVKFNAEGNDIINFDDSTFVNQNPDAPPRMGTHDFTPYIASTQRGIAYPTMVFLNEDLEMIQPIQGYLNAEQLEPILEYIGNDHYKTEAWETFAEKFQTTLK